MILTPAFSFSLFSVTRNASRLGDVGFVELRDVRNHHPVAREIGAGDLPDPRQRHAPRSARTSRNPTVGHGSRSSAPAPPVLPPNLPAHPHRLRASALTNACTSASRMRPLGPLPATTRNVDAEFARISAYRRRRVCAAAFRPGTRLLRRFGRRRCRGQGGGRTRLREARARVGTCDRGRGEVAVVRMRRRRRAAPRFRTRLCRLQRHDRRPFADRSPTETRTPSMTPPTGDGTSIVALSDSSVTSASSGLTMSPGFTNTSITGTS